jgi:ketosteroid isomerase-like protein
VVKPLASYHDSFANRTLETIVKQALMGIWTSFLLCPMVAAMSCPVGQRTDGSALVHNEQAWAKALEQRDSAVLSCLLADEFEDAGPDGVLQDRETTLIKAANHQPVHHQPVHHELTEMHFHVHGDFGYIRGLATAVDAQGKVLARVRFTDIYVYRDGRWQAVAAHESMLRDAP